MSTGGYGCTTSGTSNIGGLIYDDVTYMDIINKISSTGYIDTFCIRIYTGGINQYINFKIFRLNGTNYNIISNTDWLLVNTGSVSSVSFNLTSPVSVNYGDIIGIGIQHNNPGPSIMVESGTGVYRQQINVTSTTPVSSWTDIGLSNLRIYASSVPCTTPTCSFTLT